MRYTNYKILPILILITLCLTFGCNQNQKETNSTNYEIGSGSNTLKYVSSNNDLEEGSEIVQTNKEISYHTFDFDNKIISVRSEAKTGDWLTFEYKIKEMRTVKSLSGLESMEFDIESPICYQVWISSMGNIGYELTNNQTLVFYDVKEIQ